MTMKMKHPPHPGMLVQRQVMRPLELTVTDAAKILGVGRAALSALLNGRAALSPEMALRIEKAFGPSMDMLMRMQLAYDLARVKARAGNIAVQKYKPAFERPRAP